MSKAEIKEGDVVRIPSSNVLMTVAYVEGEKAFCVWFKDAECREQFFYISSLVKDKPL